MQGRVGIFFLSAPTVFLFGLVVIAVVEYLYDTVDGAQRTAKVEELVFFQVGVLHVDAYYRLSYVIEVL